MVTTPRLGLEDIGTTGKNLSVNNSNQIVDILLNSAIIDKDLTAPPGAPTNGDLYIVGAGATGAWATHDKALAYYRSGWVFYPSSGSPGAGHEGLLRGWVKDENKPYVWDGSAWAVESAAGLILDDLSDVVITAAAQGDILRRNGSSQWVNEKPTYDIGIGRTSGAPASNEVLLDFVFPRTCVLPASMTDSVAEAGVAATAQTDLDVQKNGASVATIRFAASGTVASFINAGADTFSAGDNLLVLAPGSPDATLADIVFTLAFTRS